MATKAKAVTGTQAQEEAKVDLKFVDYRKCNTTRLKGEFDIALIKSKNGKRYTRLTNEKGQVVLLVGARKDGTGTWNRTQLDILASDGSKESKRETIEI